MTTKHELDIPDWMNDIAKEYNDVELSMFRFEDDIIPEISTWDGDCLVPSLPAETWYGICVTANAMIDGEKHQWKCPIMGRELDDFSPEIVRDNINYLMRRIDKRIGGQQ